LIHNARFSFTFSWRPYIWQVFLSPFNYIYSSFFECSTCLYCVFKAAEKCIKGKAEEYVHASAERNPCCTQAGKGSFHSGQNELPHASEKTRYPIVKRLLTTDTAVPNADAIVITGDEDSHHFIEPVISEVSYGSGNRENTRGELPEMFTVTNSPVFDDRLQCSVCGFVFKRRRDLERHMTIHTGEKPYKCSFCDQKFRSEYQHKMHELRHKGELPQCPVCGGRYAALKSHMLIHSSDSCKHVCSLCKRAFCKPTYLKSHMLVHTGERPYTCLDCGGRYKTSTQLKLHIRSVHAGEKNHVCSDCGKKFSQREGLKAHMSIHSDEKPYHCETCGKAFKRKVGLEKHQTIHSSEKPFICSTCGKGFRQVGALKIHSLIHTGEQPYECSVCKMRFNQRSSMQRHMLTHTGEKPYSCSDCGTRFTQSGGLASHRLRHCPNRRNTRS